MYEKNTIHQFMTYVFSFKRVRLDAKHQFPNHPSSVCKDNVLCLKKRRVMIAKIAC